ncbi:NAD(P)H-hydrate dehydratase [Maribacter sp. 2307ULW6-5]|uniref:NAD(P)H-hydrate dehydratase n=1 Tax=Maribacter sp. 2307ULW6-5 TaxID=3386275 RepID=UPI0039BD548D
MKLFSAQQIYAADQHTIAQQKIDSDMLMERAAVQLFNWMHLRMQGAPVKIHLFCGIGNNGGDGIALARHLQEHGYNIGVYVVNYSDKRSDDFLVNLGRLKEKKVWPTYLDSPENFPEIGADDIIVDAVFGIGLNRTPDDWVLQLFAHLKASKAFVLSVDIPSGLFTDRAPENPEAVLPSNYVLSFQAPKLVFFLPETGSFMEQWEVLDIGLDQAFLQQQQTDFELFGKQEVLPFYVPRTKFSHKGTYGHALVVGGSHGKMGAVQLAGRAALTAGAGLVSCYVPECGLIPLQSAFPEGMVITNGERHLDNIAPEVVPQAVGLGVGMGMESKTAKALKAYLGGHKGALVLDADALNIIAKDKALLQLLPKQAVLTPHPKELERLVGPWKDDFEKLQKARKFSEKYHCVLVVKGAHTIIFHKGKGYINTTGNPGMATAGSGDVLTGIITGMLAQGYPTLEATLFAVYLHGRAGDLVLESTGYQALLASDIISGLGRAFMDLFQAPEPPQEQGEEAS